MQTYLGNRFYYGWIVVAVTFLTLLVAAGVRAAPSILINPLEDQFGWTRTSISFGISIGLLLYGLTSPAVGALMDRLGPRKMMLAGIVIIATSTAASAAMNAIWQFTMFWGVLSGIGTGITALVIGATVANRWFYARRGLVLGLMGAATSAGQLLFIPLMMWMVVQFGWQVSILILAGIASALFLPVFLLMRDDPADLELKPYGLDHIPPPPEPRLQGTHRVMHRALRRKEFWLLGGSFYICGATSTGIIGTHLIPHSIDLGIPEVTAAGVLAIMGAMNFVGTVGSGWLTDRYDPRKLLATYYILRGVSLFILPLMTDFPGLVLFAVIFGLDYIATVPPTVALTADIFGRRNVGTVFGWIFFAHQLGAAMAAWASGFSRDLLGDYHLAFLAAGVIAVGGGLMALGIDRGVRALPEPEIAPA